MATPADAAVRARRWEESVHACVRPGRVRRDDVWGPDDGAAPVPRLLKEDAHFSAGPPVGF